jgi:hypothetical protein
VAKFAGQTSHGTINVTQILAFSGHSIGFGLIGVSPSFAFCAILSYTRSRIVNTSSTSQAYTSSLHRNRFDVLALCPAKANSRCFKKGNNYHAGIRENDISYQSFVDQVNDGIATLRLNDPDVLNALMFEVYAELEQLTGELAQDETAKILVRIESWSTTS